MCKKDGCTNPPIPRGKYCNIHRTGKMCNELGCTSSARGNTGRCKSHGGGARCNELGCTSSARGNTGRCKSHGGGARCNELGCPSSARGNTGRCIVHGGGVRCNELGCPSSAQGNTGRCVTHGGGARCNELECPSSAIGNTGRCVTHGGGARCNELECPSSAIGNTGRCKSHGGGARCPNCIDWIDSRSGSSKYDDYCATCFKRLFPEDPRSTIIYSHTKEIQVRNAVIKESLTNPLFEGFVHDRPLYTSNCDCTHRRRVDHRKLIGNTMLATETDENCHTGYDEQDEKIRYDDLYMIHSGKWIFIRFNPDITRTQKSDIEDRIVVLLEVIQKQIDRIENEENEDLLEIIKLFY